MPPHHSCFVTELPTTSNSLLPPRPLSPAIESTGLDRLGSAAESKEKGKGKERQSSVRNVHETVEIGGGKLEELEAIRGETSESPAQLTQVHPPGQSWDFVFAHAGFSCSSSQTYYFYQIARPPLHVLLPPSSIFHLPFLTPLRLRSAVPSSTALPTASSFPLPTLPQSFRRQNYLQCPPVLRADAVAFKNLNLPTSRVPFHMTQQWHLRRPTATPRITKALKTNQEHETIVSPRTDGGIVRGIGPAQFPPTNLRTTRSEQEHPPPGHHRLQAGIPHVILTLDLICRHHVLRGQQRLLALPLRRHFFSRRSLSA